jgi:sterol desaturase/sphingolipid hydroxylase (fatty acid hydroxylase superfamily)
MTYPEALYEFTLEFKPLTQIEYSKSNLVFLGASLILGLIVISVDILAYYLKDKSFLDMKYNRQTKYWLVIPAWAFASTFVSYMGLIMGIFNSTIQSCVIVGFTWIYLAAKIANKSVEPETTQE